VRYVTEHAETTGDATFDERTIARKYGLQRLVYPDRAAIESVQRFLLDMVSTRSAANLPKIHLTILRRFFEGTMARQNITKMPGMNLEEYLLLQTPYGICSRVFGRILETRKGAYYQAAYHSVEKCIEFLSYLVDPDCVWMRKKLPEEMIARAIVLHDFLERYPEAKQRSDEDLEHRLRARRASGGNADLLPPVS
jgi:hypothetical protein